MLKIRLVVAAVFLPLFVWMIFLPTPVPLFILGLAAIGLAVYELGNLIAHKGIPAARWITLAAVEAAAFIAMLRLGMELSLIWLTAVLVLTLTALSLRFILDGQPEQGVPALGINLLAVALLGSFGASVFLLRQQPLGQWWIVVLFGFNWIYDAGAYFAGTRFGKHLLAPRVSPHKTVEGLLGGLAVNALAAWIAFYWPVFSELGFSRWGFVALAVGIGVFAQAGDLVESLIKRWSGLKDSGFIPGHGGILDKIDSSFFTAPLLLIIAHLLQP